MSVYENVKKIAKQRGLSLQKVAEEAGLGINSIYDWRKIDPSISKVQKVADVLHVSLNELVNDDSNNISNDTLTWLDLDMPYGGTVPDELKDYYKAMAEQYIKQHPEILKKRDEKEGMMYWHG